MKSSRNLVAIGIHATALRRATASHSRHSSLSAPRYPTPQPPLDDAGASHLSRPAHRQPGDVLQPRSATSTTNATAAHASPACATSARPSPTHASATCATTSILSTALTSTALTSTAELGHRGRRGGGMDLRSPRSSPRFRRSLRPRPCRGHPRQSRCRSGAARTTQGAGGGSGGRGVPRDVETRRWYQT